MIEILTTAEQRIAAKEQAAQMGYAGSMMQGQRDAHASLAEIVACEYVGGQMVRDYNHDFRTWWGLKVDVKNKVRSVPPQPHYAVNIFTYNKNQDCDFLLFTSTPKDGSRVWIVGGYGKASFLRDAKIVKAGEKFGPNQIAYKRDNYEMQIKDIGQAAPVVAMLRGKLDPPRGKTFAERLESVATLEELDGFANRRRVLQCDLPRWTQSEIEQIKERKWQLERETRHAKKF